MFNAPKDKIVWDVGHQTYVHKILTGRKDKMNSLRKRNGIAGFPKREESEYDTFNTGHSSTSISAAIGMARARDIKKENYQIVAVIGDGNYAVHEAEILKPIAKSVRIITNGKSMVQNRNIDVETIKDSVKEVKGKDILEEIEFANGKTIKIDGVFVAEGIATSTDLAKRIGALVEGNNIKINENMETSVRGLYACGDCTGGILQISKAVYEGAKAGLEIIKKEDKNVSN